MDKHIYFSYYFMNVAILSLLIVPFPTTAPDAISLGASARHFSREMHVIFQESVASAKG